MVQDNFFYQALMKYSIIIARSIHKLKDKDPPAAQSGDPLVKRVQKRSASFCKE